MYAHLLIQHCAVLLKAAVLKVILIKKKKKKHCKLTTKNLEEVFSNV